MHTVLMVLPRAGAWCSPVNTIPCHGIDRRFKSGRARSLQDSLKKTTDLSGSVVLLLD